MADVGARGDVLPDYVQTVLDSLQRAAVEPVRRLRRRLPDRFSPIVISVIKNELDRLHDFLRHYRALGVERFAFIDNHSTDGSIEYLADQPDVDVYRCHDSFNWMAKQGWISRIVAACGADRWYVYVDADEHLVFEGAPLRTLGDLAQTMERRGLSRVRGLLIDMYGAGALIDSRYESDSRLAASYPFFDRDGYREARFKEIISVKGGPRRRAFADPAGKFNPELTKYPLFCPSSSEYMVNPHHLWPYDKNFASDRYIGVLHYKFLPGIIERIRKAVDNKTYWDDSFEYRCYLEALQKSPQLSLHDPAVSAAYRGPSSLLEAKLIAPVQWDGENAAVARMLGAFHARRAALMGRGGSRWAARRTAA